jgi:hypothetical protein
VGEKMDGKKLEKNVVGVVCMGVRWGKEVFVFIPKDTNKTICVDSSIKFLILVQSFLKEEKEVHFDFETVPKEVYAYNSLVVEECKRLTKSQQENFLDQYFQ